MQRRFMPRKAARLTRTGPSLMRYAKQFSTNKSKERIVEDVAKLVLQKRPFRVEADSSKSFKKSFQGTAEKIISKQKPIGALGCVERCTLAIGLLRALRIKAWLAREITLETTGKWAIHDYVEFFEGGKVRTLAFGTSFESGIGEDYYMIIDGPANNIATGQFIYRGIDSVQIGGAKTQDKLQEFLKKPISVKQMNKDYSRIQTLIKSGIIPKKAYEQIFSWKPKKQ